MGTKKGAQPQTNDPNLENDLINESKDRGGAEASSGNPAHDTTSQTGSELSPGPAQVDVNTAGNELGDQAKPVSTEKNMDLPQMVKQGTTEIPLPQQVENHETQLNPGNQVGDQAQGEAPMFLGDSNKLSPGDLHAERVKKFGTDYVVTRKGNRQQVWNRQSWESIRGDKGGWQEAPQIPPEVRELRQAKK